MEDKNKTKKELIIELENLRHSVSELEQLEARLNGTEQFMTESEERYRVLIENLSEGIFVFKDGFFRFASSRAVELLGYRADELISRSSLDLIHPDDREMVIRRRKSRMAGDDTPYEYTVRMVAHDGNIKWLDVMSRGILWHGERASLVSVTDATRRKAAEDALRESEDKTASDKFARMQENGYGKWTQKVRTGTAVPLWRIYLDTHPMN
ncbi:MAG: PAS domain-containing protein [Desulfomonilaceae bacterium]